MTGTSLIITDVDAETVKRLEAEARRRGVEVPKLARDLLRQSLSPVELELSNLSGQEDAVCPPGPFRDLDFLAGTWTEADAAEFEEATADFRRIDPELWK